ncbi:MAG: rhomboid family intramembrane serine protease [Flavobacteriales bacterium]
MNSHYAPRRANRITPVTQNLLLINILLFLATVTLTGANLPFHLGGFYFKSPFFKPWQPLTSMFMHGSLSHLAFNMLALWMFGTPLERLWGAKRFLIFYFSCGLGAYFLHDVVTYLHTNPIQANWMESGQNFNEFLDVVKKFPQSGRGYAYPADVKTLFMVYITPVVGASGAIYGLLIAFALYYPNAELIFILFPIPLKAKYFVPFMMVFELFLGWQNFSGDNVAHFAHIGGALLGFLLIKYWRATDKR